LADALVGGEIFGEVLLQELFHEVESSHLEQPTNFFLIDEKHSEPF
jgi:hypothetical protein